MLGEDLGKPVCLLDDLCGFIIMLPEEGVGGDDIGLEVHLAGDLAGDRHVVAGDHLDVESHLLRRLDGCRGISAGRVVETEDADVYPGTGGVAPCNAENPVAFLCEGLGETVDRLIEILSPAGEGEDHLRCTFCDRELPTAAIVDDGLGAFYHRIERPEFSDGIGLDPIFEALRLL